MRRYRRKLPRRLVQLKHAVSDSLLIKSYLLIKLLSQVANLVLSAFNLENLLFMLPFFNQNHDFLSIHLSLQPQLELCLIILFEFAHFHFKQLVLFQFFLELELVLFGLLKPLHELIHFLPSFLLPLLLISTHPFLL